MSRKKNEELNQEAKEAETQVSADKDLEEEKAAVKSDKKQETPKLKLAEKPRSLKERWDAIRYSDMASVLLSLLVPLITIVTTEWIARGDFAPNKQGNGFFQAVVKHFPSFLIAYLLLVLIYIFIVHITAQHWPATLVVGLLGNVPAVVTYYKLTMRGEPFLPWDLSQISDLMGVSDSIELSIQPNMIICAVLLLVLTVLSGFVKLPRGESKKQDWRGRLLYSGVSLGLTLVMIFVVFLNSTITSALGIVADPWMQDRYYRNHGVVTGFLTNTQMLRIDVPEDYGKDTVQEVVDKTLADKLMQPYYEESYAAETQDAVQQPDIIYLMAESFWDVTALEGIEYDREILPNLTRLREEGASGYVYTPSFGGGTCDVEFEALTGFSMEHLPAGSKPYQQYVTDDTFSMPNYLKSTGYDTLAIHGYGRKFWNRAQAYPRLGIDNFIASDDFVNPDRRRGFVSDHAMVQRIAEEQQEQAILSDSPMFIHAVTMQNHTTYDPSKYPADELVKVTQYPDAISETVIGQLEDCATGIYEMDAALGELTNYLRTVDRPTIVVFWGDHMNPMSDGYGLFEKTGFIEEGDTASANLRQTPLLIWSNYADNKVELGTIAAYNISPVVMDLYGIEKPLMFEFLMEQMDVMHGRTRGVTVEPDNTTSLEMNEAQQATFYEHSILQYDYLFGNKTLPTYAAGDA